MSDKTISKIKYDGKRVKIAYEVQVGEGEPDSYTLDCADDPKASFKEALCALAAHVAAALDMPHAWADDLNVRGVSLSWSHDIMGACITALKPVSGRQSPWVINTPHAPSEPYSETGGEEYTLSPELVEALSALIDEAAAYIDGKRAQGNLFSATEAA